MKKLIIVALLIMYSTLLFGQTFTYKAEAVKIQFLNEDGVTWDTVGWKQSNVTITLRAAKQILSINNTYNDTFKLLSIITESSGVDSEGDKWALCIYKAIDQNFKDVQIGIKEFDSGIKQFGVVYKDVAYVYQCGY